MTEGRPGVHPERPSEGNKRPLAGGRVQECVDMARKSHGGSSVKHLPPEPTGLTWEELVKVEPRLGKLLQEIKKVDTRVLCFEQQWFATEEVCKELDSVTGGFKDKMSELVGWSAGEEKKKTTKKQTKSLAQTSAEFVADYVRPVRSKATDARLRTSTAYDIAYQKLYREAPECRCPSCRKVPEQRAREETYTLWRRMADAIKPEPIPFEFPKLSPAAEHVHTLAEYVAWVASFPEGAHIAVVGPKGNAETFRRLKKEGYQEFLVDDQRLLNGFSTESFIQSDPDKHDIAVVIDKFTIRAGSPSIMLDPKAVKTNEEDWESYRVSDTFKKYNAHDALFHSGAYFLARNFLERRIAEAIKQTDLMGGFNVAILNREGKKKETTEPTLVFPDDPVDLWQERKAPALPKGLLPAVIEQFAFQQGELMGADPAGLAMGALVVCAAAIPDSIRIQVKQHDKRWLESTRIWVGLAGPVSAKKSPIMRVVCDPIDEIDKELSAEYAIALAEYEAAEEDEGGPEPVRMRLRVEDATPESLQVILEYNDQGLLMKRDELSGWFGQMEKYSGGGRGASADRGFWLTSFNGGFYVFDRVKRGSGTIKNLSVNLLGGIQVEALRQVVADGVDDGLLQRLFVIMLRPAVLGRDEPVEHDQYDRLVNKLFGLRERRAEVATARRKDDPSDCGRPVLGNVSSGRTVKFTDEAAAIRWKLEQKHLDLQQAYQSVNRKLASHIGKFDGLFARLCLLWQIIETVDKANAKGFDYYAWPEDIEAETAQRVADFMHRFLLNHAITFYVNELGLSDDHDRLSAVAGYILARKLDQITRRDIQRGDHTMRKIKGRDTNDVFEQLEALGWLVRKQGMRLNEVIWLVNPAVHVQFEARAKQEAKRRAQQHADIVASIRGED
jgi:hypothetical protein